MGNETINVPSRRSSALRAAVAMAKSGESDPTKLREAAVSAAAASDRTREDPPPDDPSNGRPPPEDTQRQPADGAPPPETDRNPADEQPPAPERQEPTEEDPKPKPPKKPKKEPEPEPELPDDPRAALEQLVGQSDADLPTDDDDPDADDTPPPRLKKDKDRPGVLPTDTESVRKRITKFEALISEAETAREKAEQELATTRQQLQQVQEKPAITPELEEELKTLRTYKMRYELENDPKIKEQFDAKISDAESTITDILKDTKYAWIADEAKKAGGFDRLFRSRSAVGVTKDDKGKDVELTGAELYKRMLDLLPGPDADIVRNQISQQMSLRRERERTIASRSKEVDEAIKKDQEAAATKEAERAQRKQAVDDVIGRFHQTAVEKLPWLKPEEIPAEVDGEERKAIASSNKVREVSGKLFKTYVDNPILREAAMIAPDQDALTTLGTILLDASRVFHVEQELKRAQARIKQLDTQVRRLKGGARTTPRTTRTPPSTAEPSKTARPERQEGESHLRYGVRLAEWQQSQASSED